MVWWIFQSEEFNKIDTSLHTNNYLDDWDYNFGICSVGSCSFFNCCSFLIISHEFFFCFSVGGALISSPDHRKKVGEYNCGQLKTTLKRENILEKGVKWIHRWRNQRRWRSGSWLSSPSTHFRTPVNRTEVVTSRAPIKLIHPGISFRNITFLKKKLSYKFLYWFLNSI